MAARTLEAGKTYRIKLTSGNWVAARFVKQTETGGYISRQAGQRLRNSVKRYHFTNLASGRTVVIKSLLKVRDQEARHVFFNAAGEVVLESDVLPLMLAKRLGAEFMQDRETGTRYDVLPDGPLIDRLRKIG